MVYVDVEIVLMVSVAMVNPALTMVSTVLIETFCVVVWPFKAVAV